jgi:hypothetical protein
VVLETARRMCKANMVTCGSDGTVKGEITVLFVLLAKERRVSELFRRCEHATALDFKDRL